ncbi:adenosylcobinamide-GDP ribazoletransferase [Thioalkalivibrio sp. ALJ16]|uniref:adenosylcobinamide-GDP ribazoletransferase n=1 Tax=Thioalkalivibrio sp. ALJ16 TaxID=1158762 RepID=UPI00036F88C5|nr:adenosylcobinamide-GDP ribazoletransferase [Thioalkalivibrio sp. ALJ16]
MNAVLAPVWLAVQFLTRLPTPALKPRPEDLGRALLAYPLVGLVLGLLLALVGMALMAIPGVPSLLVAALLLALWVGLTGALHLDGLADSVDAWVGSHRDPERARAIMKDPASGPMAVAALILVLLIKFAALVAVVEAGAWLVLLVAVVLGRAALPGLFLLVPYVSPQGLGAAMAAHLPRRLARAVLAVTGLLIVLLALLAWQWTLILGLAATLLLVPAIAAFLRRWLGGFTGDTAGAGLELVEVATLVVMTLALTVY